jgi:hypothetical protein
MIKLGIPLGQLLEEDIERIFLLGNHEWSELNLTELLRKRGLVVLPSAAGPGGCGTAGCLRNL